MRRPGRRVQARDAAAHGAAEAAPRHPVDPRPPVCDYARGPATFRGASRSMNAERSRGGNARTARAEGEHHCSKLFFGTSVHAHAHAHARSECTCTDEVRGRGARFGSAAGT